MPLLKVEMVSTVGVMVMSMAYLVALEVGTFLAGWVMVMSVVYVVVLEVEMVLVGGG